MKLKPVLYVFSGCLLLVAAFFKFSAGNEGVIARVDGVPVMEETFRFWWNRNIPPEDTPETRRKVLNQLIERTALVKQAREVGLDRDPEILEAINSLLIARLKEKELQPRLAAISVTDEEARNLYESNLEQFAIDEKKRVAVLWFNTRGLEPLVARYKPRLDSIRTGLEADPESVELARGFGDLALKNSEHRASRHRGGDLGWIEDQAGLDQWQNVVVEIARDLEAPGEVSPVTVTPEGLFLVRLIDSKTASIAPFEKVKPQILHSLAQSKREEIGAEFQERFGKAQSVAIDSDRLSSVENLSTSVQKSDAIPTPKFSLNKQ